MSDTPRVGADRSGMLARYEAAVGIKVATEEAPAEASAKEDSAIPESKSDAQPKSEPTVKAPVAPIAKEVVADPGVKAEVENPDETKTVPLAALHEAREKYKAKNLEARKLQDQLGAKDQELGDLKTRLAALEDTIRKAQAGDSDEPASEEVTKLVEENKKLKAAQTQSEQEKKQSAVEAAKEATTRFIKETDTALTQEGYPGFEKFGRDVLEAITAKIKSGEIEEKDVTPDFTKEVYRKEVYPKAKAIFAAQVAKEKQLDKTAAKKKANLGNSPGEAPQPKEEENLDAPQTAESYMKFRKSIK